MRSLACTNDPLNPIAEGDAVAGLRNVVAVGGAVFEGHVGIVAEVSASESTQGMQDGAEAVQRVRAGRIGVNGRLQVMRGLVEPAEPMQQRSQ